LFSHDLFGKPLRKNVPAALAASPHFFIALFGDRNPSPAKKKPDRSAHRRIMVRLTPALLSHIKPRQYRPTMAKPGTRLDVSPQGSALRLLLLLAGLLLCLLRFLGFLGHLTLHDPKKLVQCKSTSTCITPKYTTIGKLILRASNKVNGDHAVVRCVGAEPLSRCVDASSLSDDRAAIDMEGRRAGSASIQPLV
jgi:hypothetical protein